MRAKKGKGVHLQKSEDPAVHKADQTVEEATLEKVNIFLILLNQETKVEKEKDSVTTVKQDTLRILSKLFELQVEWPVQLQAYIEIILIESWQFFAKLDTIVIGSFFVVALHDFVDRDVAEVVIKRILDQNPKGRDIWGPAIVHCIMSILKLHNLPSDTPYVASMIAVAREYDPLHGMDQLYRRYGDLSPEALLQRLTHILAIASNIADTAPLTCRDMALHHIQKHSHLCVQHMLVDDVRKELDADVIRDYLDSHVRFHLHTCLMAEDYPNPGSPLGHMMQRFECEGLESELQDMHHTLHMMSAMRCTNFVQRAKLHSQAYEILRRYMTWTLKARHLGIMNREDRLKHALQWRRILHYALLPEDICPGARKTARHPAIMCYSLVFSAAADLLNRLRPSGDTLLLRDLLMVLYASSPSQKVQMTGALLGYTFDPTCDELLQYIFLRSPTVNDTISGIDDVTMRCLLNAAEAELLLLNDRVSPTSVRSKQDILSHASEYLQNWVDLLLKRCYPFSVILEPFIRSMSALHSSIQSVQRNSRNCREISDRNAQLIHTYSCAFRQEAELQQLYPEPELLGKLADNLQRLLGSMPEIFLRSALQTYISKLCSQLQEYDIYANTQIIKAIMHDPSGDLTLKVMLGYIRGLKKQGLKQAKLAAAITCYAAMAMSSLDHGKEKESIPAMHEIMSILGEDATFQQWAKGNSDVQEDWQKLNTGARSISGMTGFWNKMSGQQVKTSNA